MFWYQRHHFNKIFWGSEKSWHVLNRKRKPQEKRNMTRLVFVGLQILLSSLVLLVNWCRGKVRKNYVPQSLFLRPPRPLLFYFFPYSCILSSFCSATIALQSIYFLSGVFASGYVNKNNRNKARSNIIQIDRYWRNGNTMNEGYSQKTTSS